MAKQENDINGGGKALRYPENDILRCRYPCGTDRRLCGVRVTGYSEIHKIPNEKYFLSFFKKVLFQERLCRYVLQVLRGNSLNKGL